jgi:uncharacterized alkaline shock family protein YloU
MYNLPIPEEPMTDETTPLGRHVSPHAIASIAYHAALQSYGVVGLTSKSLIEGLAHVLVKDPTKGVEVQYAGQSIRIDLYVIIEYGTRIKSVATSVSKHPLSGRKRLKVHS